MYDIGPFVYQIGRRAGSRVLACKKPIHIGAHDFVLISGESGAGKSTMLKMFKGLIPEFSVQDISGVFTYNQKPLSGNHFKENLKEILFLFQDPFSQIIHPTVPEEFYFSMENLKFTKTQMDDQRIYLSKLFDLDKIWNQKTANISNGECQKLVLSSLLAIGPKVLLFDEPTAFLDPKARRDFYHWLKTVKGKMTIIMVDHHQEEVHELVDYCLFIDRDGEISKCSMQEVLTKRKLDFPHDQSSLRSNIKKNQNGLMLKIEELSFAYPARPKLFHKISLEVHAGEVMVIKGENGAGKSTLFKLISGVIKAPSKGICLMDQQQILKDKIRQKMTGLIFQNPESHFFYDTIEEELGDFLKLETNQKLIEKFFHQIDLKRSPFLLSEGEKRRLSILIALSLKKKILLYDEPTFGQDVKSKFLIAELIAYLKTEGCIQMIISHDDEFIDWVADSVYELQQCHLERIK